MWPFNRKPATIADDVCWTAQLWAVKFPPITRAQQQAAAARLYRPPLPANYTDAEGRTVVHWYRGTVDPNDYTLRDGYVVSLAGTDRFGWPAGHPDSPATERPVNSV